MYQNSQNKGTEFLIPDYNLFDIGLFAIAKKSWNKLDISGGLRYDSRTENGKDLWLDENGSKTTVPDANSLHQFTQFNADFGEYQAMEPHINLFRRFYQLNISRGFRSPNIAERFLQMEYTKELSTTSSVHLHLKAENSLQLDYALGLNTQHVTAEADLFYNDIATTSTFKTSGAGWH